VRRFDNVNPGRRVGGESRNGKATNYWIPGSACGGPGMTHWTDLNGYQMSTLDRLATWALSPVATMW
jgi:hypothetical protein